MVDKLNELDLKIINQLYENGRLSITELAARLGSSRPTITNRLERLIKDEVLAIKGGLNLRKLGFKIANVGIEVKEEEARKDIEGYKSTIESFRDLHNAEIIYTLYLGTPIHGNIIINLNPFDKTETPCGKICSECHRYSNEWCVGCPSTIHYKNPIQK
jgi:DNA-binding Lrp family transcriptional regulator